MKGEFPDFDKISELYNFEKPMATRQASAKVLNVLAKEIPNLIGGSADLAPSNLSDMKDTNEIIYGSFSSDNFVGRNVHFGIREHAMAAISNGLQVHGGLRAYCSTFFVFSDYCKPAMRLSALMKLPVTYSGKNALQGGYVLEDCEGTPDVLLIATGSEVELCMKAKAVLAEDGIRARVVSLPCMEEYEKQSDAYKESIIPKTVKARVCVEAGSSFGWCKYAGDNGEIISMESFGASAAADMLFHYYGFTVDNVVAKAKISIEKTK